MKSNKNKTNKGKWAAFIGIFIFFLIDFVIIYAFKITWWFFFGPFLMISLLGAIYGLIFYLRNKNEGVDSFSLVLKGQIGESEFRALVIDKLKTKNISPDFLVNSTTLGTEEDLTKQVPVSFSIIRNKYNKSERYFLAVDLLNIQRCIIIERPDESKILEYLNFLNKFQVKKTQETIRTFNPMTGIQTVMSKEYETPLEKEIRLEKEDKEI